MLLNKYMNRYATCIYLFSTQHRFTLRFTHNFSSLIASIVCYAYSLRFPIPRWACDNKSEINSNKKLHDKFIWAIAIKIWLQIDLSFVRVSSSRSIRFGNYLYMDFACRRHCKKWNILLRQMELKNLCTSRKWVWVFHLYTIIGIIKLLDKRDECFDIFVNMFLVRIAHSVKVAADWWVHHL